MTTQEARETIGKELLYVAQRIPAPVTVVDHRRSYGSDQWLVRDCASREHWVNADSCAPVGASASEQTTR